MKIAIVGPGSIGLLFSGIFHQAGVDITLIDYRQKRVDFLNEKGIQWDGLDKKIHFNIPVINEIKNDIDFDLIIIAVKAYSTEIVANNLKKSGYSGTVLTLQNGLGNVDILTDILPEAGILAGTTSEGATLLNTGHVRHAGKGLTAFGEVIKGRTGDDFINKISELMKNSGLNIEITENIDSFIWTKLLINVGINALTGIYHVKNGDLLGNNYTESLMETLVNEAHGIAEKLKISIPIKDIHGRVKEVCKLTATNYSSLYQDLNFGRKTEIDFINGAVVREGEKIGIDCPYNKIITDIVHGLENYNIK